MEFDNFETHQLLALDGSLGAVKYTVHILTVLYCIQYLI